MRFRVTNNTYKIKKVLMHISFMLFLCVGYLIVLFEYGLPCLTKHNQSITVPDIKGMTISEVANTLKKRDLKYECNNDIAYSPDYPPSVVLEQHPKAGTYVKEGRRLYVTLNAKQAPEVMMPNLVDNSLRHAYIMLKNRGLSYNKITYVPDVARNAVIAQHYQGAPIMPDTPIFQGSAIDLMVGSGLNNPTTQVPDLQGILLHDAVLMLLDVGLQPGVISYEKSTTSPPKAVIKQRPYPDQRVKLGSCVDIWISEKPEEVSRLQE